jgi:amino acid transporter
MNEIKDPVKTIKRSAPLSLLLVAILYMLCNVAYFAAVPKADILAAETTTASLFFTAVFGEQAAKGLNMLVILSAFGNLVTVLIGQSRVIREIGRQGVLPYPKFWVTTKPFGTPIGPYLLKWGMTVLMIVAPPAGDAFNLGEFHRGRDSISFGCALTMCDSGRPPELPRVRVLLRNGSRHLSHPPSTYQARCR